ncbi:hypothetical protein BHE74_00017016 [Ensete ventricosum]|nr:hypothetical protein GW17_00026221 [Ensete ventricosum]RWW74982.1 hypothetical protein BHE74_00017016 [Ensete ventricosum]
MTGSGGSSSARVSGVDRFYSPPAVRRQLELQRQQQKLQQQRQQQKEEATLRTRPSPVATTEAVAVAEVMLAKERFERDDASSKRSLSSSSSPSPSPSPTPPPLPPASVGNLYRLLESTTPVVPARYFSKVRNGRRWRNGDEVKSQPYFCLGDLWESFKEWSAYGAGVPLVLDGSHQGIPKHVNVLRYAVNLLLGCVWRSAKENDGNRYLDTSSEGSSGSEENQSIERSSSVDTTSHIGQGGFVNDNTVVCPKPTLPIFEYFEKDTPYGREPLADKIPPVHLQRFFALVRVGTARVPMTGL